MKKHTIIISIILGAGIFLTCLTCTYFDPWEAGGIGEPEPPVFWIDWYGTIFKSNIDSPSDKMEIFSPQEESNPYCIVADPIRQKIYWASYVMNDSDPYQIHRANYDGSEVDRFHWNNMETITSIAFDSGKHELFFSEGMKIRSISTEGEPFVNDILTPGTMNISDIALDIENNWIYYATSSTDFYRINMDGTNQTTFQTSASIIEQIAYDRTENRIICSNNTAIFYFQNIVSPGINDPVTTTDQTFSVLDLLVDPMERYVYWLDEGGPYPAPPHGILKTEITGSGGREEILVFGQDESGMVFTIGFMGQDPPPEY